jgi:MFS family permease
VILVALLVIRKDPQSMGLQPDGIQTSRPDGADDNVTRPPMDEEYSWTRPEALRTFAFWSLVLVFGLSMLGISTLHVFRIPFYIEQGIAPDLVAWAVSIEALVAAAASIVTGRIVDRVQPRFVVAGSFLSYLLMLIVTMNLSAVWHVYVSAALFGISAASYIVAQNTLWPVYFGSVHIGSIRGVSQITGSYMPAWIGAFILISLSLVLMLGTKKPRPPAQSNLDIFRDTPVLRARFPERPG